MDIRESLFINIGQDCHFRQGVFQEQYLSARGCLILYTETRNVPRMLFFGS